jgi:uncharacterized protein with GYD domain
VPKYLFVATYNSEGAQGLLDGGGSARRTAISEMAESVGGSVEAFYFAFGGEDAFVIVDLPDDEAAASIGITVGASGKASVRTVTLLTPEQVDSAAERSPAYRPPGD